jgi:CRP-like cAMP-binding protein
LKAANYKYETYFRSIAERSTAFMQRRIISDLTQSAEERYTLFLEKYPLMADRFPQYVIASYLGMTTEFLSKIRNRKVKRKS